MSNLIKSLSNEEIKNYTKEGKGLTTAQCAYYISLCTVGIPGAGGGTGGLDCGTCSYIFQQCGYKPGGGGGGNCGTCTCK